MTKLCGRRTREDKPCKNKVTPGRDACHKHGGKSLVGPASATWKHGRRSKYVPERMLAGYNEALNDPELLSTRHEIALMEQRYLDLLKRVDGGESGKMWASVAEKWDAFLHCATMASNTGGAEQVKWLARQNIVGRELGELINGGVADYAAWHEVGKVLDILRRLKETERKRLVEAQQLVQTDQVLALLARNVKDTVDAVRELAPPDVAKKIISRVSQGYVEAVS